MYTLKTKETIIINIIDDLFECSIAKENFIQELLAQELGVSSSYSFYFFNFYIVCDQWYCTEGSVIAKS